MHRASASPTFDLALALFGSLDDPQAARVSAHPTTAMVDQHDRPVGIVARFYVPGDNTLVTPLRHCYTASSILDPGRRRGANVSAPTVPIG
jgi:hypothetical protein